MKAVLQRVARASVKVDGTVVSSIGSGLLVLLGVEQGDSEEDAGYLARKTTELRIFADENGKMNRSLIEEGGALLAVSQFTLLADWRKGRRPGFTRAAAPETGQELYLSFVEAVRRLGVSVSTGVFGAHMEVELVNDGPVTLILDTREPAQ